MLSERTPRKQQYRIHMHNLHFLVFGRTERPLPPAILVRTQAIYTRTHHPFPFFSRRRMS